jgi:hypothetical protein
MTQYDDDLKAKRRQRNYVMGGLLCALVILFYLLTMAKLGAR